MRDLNSPSFLLAFALCATACSSPRGTGESLDLAGVVIANPNDHDGDGYTTGQGDCNDSDAKVGPMAFEIAGNGIDDDCDGNIDNVVAPCDGATVGKTGAADLAAAMGICDARFIVSTTFAGPSDVRAHAIVNTFGSFSRMEGASMALLSTGIAADKSSPGYVRPQPGTELSVSNQAPNPDPTLLGSASCGSSQPSTVNDYTEVAITLHVPQNASSLAFKFHFFSAEFPEYVCTAYNDEFLVEMASKKNGGAFTNVSFDANKNPITINNSFFTICRNDTGKPQTQHCTKPVDGLVGTGYEDELAGKPIGGSTGWLSTKAPVTPGDDITLRFIVFDEDDHIFDSAVLIDAFVWSPDVYMAPVTIQ